MLNTNSEIINEFLVRLGVSTSVAFYTDTIVKDWEIQAARWAMGYRKWPFTEGRVSTTYASLVTNEDGDLLGEYPEGWKSDSIRILQIGGKRLRKLNYEDFRTFREEESSSDERVYSDFGLNYVINPEIDATGTVTAWGQFTPLIDPTDESAKTVFSNNAEEGNEAIVLKMISFAKKREGDLNAGKQYDSDAVATLDKIWDTILKEQYKYQTHDSSGGMWKRFNVLDGGFKDDITENQF